LNFLLKFGYRTSVEPLFGLFVRHCGGTGKKITEASDKDSHSLISGLRCLDTSYAGIFSLRVEYER